MSEKDINSHLIKRIFLGILTTGLFLIVLAVIIRLPENEGLEEIIRGNIDKSGVSNKVTAVLLNFRGYDTLIEVGVLLLAVAGVLSIRTADTEIIRYQSAKPVDAVLSAFSRLIAPLIFLVSCYLLFAGAYAPGGAFQAGSVLAALFVLLRLSDMPPPRWINVITAGMIASGFLVFLATAGVLVATGVNLLQYPSEYAGSIIFFIETAIMASTAFIFAELFSEWRHDR